MKKVLSKSKTPPKQVRPNKKLASLPHEPDAEEKLREKSELAAERARVSGFIRLDHLPHIFVHGEKYPDTLLDRLWKHFECDRVPQIRYCKTRYEMWFWLFERWANIPDDFWRDCESIPHLSLYDFKTKSLKKECYGGRNGLDIIYLEDLKKYIENISKSLNTDFPLPSLLFPVTSECPTFEHSEDFRSAYHLGKPYSLTSRQADIIKMLFEAWERKMPNVPIARILDKLGTPDSRLRDSFKSRPLVWKNLIRSDSKGTIRLNIP